MRGSSRAVVAIGMHRSGTSAVARGLAALGVYLGDDFLDAQPENPTGYWEDRGIVELNERILERLGLRWDDAGAVDARGLRGWRMWPLRRKSTRYLRRRFIARTLWGFKDPRTIRLLPFWLDVMRASGVRDSYLLVIRNPSSVAASLYARQRMPTEEAQRLWIAYVVPFLGLLREKPLVVVDYDLLMRDPTAQLERIAQRLHLPPAAPNELAKFAGEFLDDKLRHTVFAPGDIDATTQAGLLTRRAYVLLHDVAADRRPIDAAFWHEWGALEASVELGGRG